MGNRDAMIGYLEHQGAKVRKSKKGLFIQYQGGTTTIHNTPSDRRALANEIAEFRRLGLVHPQDKRMNKAAVTYPPYVFRNISAETERKARALLHSMGWPLEITAMDIKEHFDPPQAARIFYHLGYRWHPDGKRRAMSKVWVASEEIEQWHNEVTAAREVERALEESVRREIHVPRPAEPPLAPVHVEQVVPEAPEPERVTEAPTPAPEPSEQESLEECEDGGADDIEFIDERDSWVVDLEELFGSAILGMMRSKLSVLDTVGMGYEMRVWRKK